MKISIGSYVLRWAVGTSAFVPTNPLTPQGLLDCAAAAGAQVVQICDNMPIDHLTDAELRQLLQHARTRRLDLEVGIRGGRPELLRRYLSIARILESPLLRMVISDDEWIPDFDTILSMRVRSSPQELGGYRFVIGSEANCSNIGEFRQFTDVHHQ